MALRGPLSAEFGLDTLAGPVGSDSTPCSSELDTPTLEHTQTHIHTHSAHVSGPSDGEQQDSGMSIWGHAC